MPLGATSSVYAWHRIGNLLAWLLLVHARCPLGRYVDDFFGASRAGVSWTGGRMMDMLCNCLGFLSDPKKSCDSSWTMDVLGLEVDLVWAQKLVRLRVMPEIARWWLAILGRLLEDRRLSAEESAKMAGRLSFAVTMSANRVGRAFIKPFYAQSNDPLPGGRCSSWLLTAAAWWRSYLSADFTSEHTTALARQHFVCWTDAAGQSRLIAAVVASPRGIWFTRCRAPDFIRDQLSPRDDHQIGVQEALAVMLLQASFPRLLVGSLVTNICGY